MKLKQRTAMNFLQLFVLFIVMVVVAMQFNKGKEKVTGRVSLNVPEYTAPLQNIPRMSLDMDLGSPSVGPEAGNQPFGGNEKEQETTLNHSTTTGKAKTVLPTENGVKDTNDILEMSKSDLENTLRSVQGELVPETTTQYKSLESSQGTVTSNSSTVNVNTGTSQNLTNDNAENSTHNSNAGGFYMNVTNSDGSSMSMGTFFGSNSSSTGTGQKSSSQIVKDNGNSEITIGNSIELQNTQPRSRERVLSNTGQ